MKVRNMVSTHSGREVANQFIIEHDGNTYFQSYESLIAKVDANGNVTLYPDFDYSMTTSKYLRSFLKEYAYRTYYKLQEGKSFSAACRKAIEDGYIQYEDAEE